MADWIEDSDAYEIKLHKTNMRNIREVEIDVGIICEFGDPARKTGHPKLMSVAFLKKHWTPEKAYDWWGGHEIYVVPKRHRGKKVPFIDILVNDDKHYILACLRGTSKDCSIARFCKENNVRLND